MRWLPPPGLLGKPPSGHAESPKAATSTSLTQKWSRTTGSAEFLAVSDHFRKGGRNIAVTLPGNCDSGVTERTFGATLASRVLRNLGRPRIQLAEASRPFQSSSPKEATMTPLEIGLEPLRGSDVSSAGAAHDARTCLFYGGMVRAKSVLNMMMMSFGALASIAVIWVSGATPLPSATTWLRPARQSCSVLGSEGPHGATTEVSFNDQTGTYPVMAFVAFQAVFAIITVALISGAIADRAKFSTWMIFTVIWATLVYFPVAHWVFDFSAGEHVGGWIANTLKAIDFAGGTAVHINAGAAGLALAIILGKRLGWKRDPMRPHNLTLVMLGAGLLWFGWFGFNAGSAIAAGTTSATVWVNTMVATGAASLAWLITERIRDGHATSLGARPASSPAWSLSPRPAPRSHRLARSSSVFSRA